MNHVFAENSLTIALHLSTFPSFNEESTSPKILSHKKKQKAELRQLSLSLVTGAKTRCSAIFRFAGGFNTPSSLVIIQYLYQDVFLFLQASFLT
jgi:hypothetical protein